MVGGSPGFWRLASETVLCFLELTHESMFHLPAGTVHPALDSSSSVFCRVALLPLELHLLIRTDPQLSWTYMAGQ